MPLNEMKFMEADILLIKAFRDKQAIALKQWKATHPTA